MESLKSEVGGQIIISPLSDIFLSSGNVLLVVLQKI